MTDLNISQRLLDEITLAKLGMVGLRPDVADRYPSELSGGMIKRIALARAMALDPELLFLDEPTAGLDPELSEGFVKLIKTMQSELTFTIVMATHDLDTLVALSDRVAVLADKRLVALGTLREVINTNHTFVSNFFCGVRGRKTLRSNNSIL